jgi:peptidoglycan/xylan/chitin deacetylase (PgdA/CDA1 family)
MRIWLYIGSSEKYKPKIKYTFELLFSIYGLKCSHLDSLEESNKSIIAKEDLLIVYDKWDNLAFFQELSSDKFDLFFLADLFAQVFEAQTPPAFKKLVKTDSGEETPVLFNFSHLEENNLYSIEAEEKKNYSGITWKENEKNLEVIFFTDLIASSYYLISFQEEIRSGRKDKRGRFKAEFSFRKANDLIDYPLVNIYFKIIFDLIRRRFLRRGLPLIRKSFWPGGAALAVALTHDVDIMERWMGYAVFMAFQLLKAGKIGSFFLWLKKFCKSILTNRNPARSFDFIIKKEKEMDFGSTFFFLAGEPNLRSFLQRDIIYDITKKANRTLLKKIDTELHEVGLHGSYHSFSEQDRMMEEKSLLERIRGDSLTGIRQHFLRFDLPQTWYLQKNLNFLYDCSFGYPDASGFRSGLGFPFYPYDDSRDEPIGILELSTNIMDQTYVKYKNQDLLKMKKEILEILDRVEGCGGLVTLLWHTNVVDELTYFGFMDTYQEILRYLKQKKAFVGSGQKIALWWQKREKLIQLDCSISDKGTFCWEYESRDFMDIATLELHLSGIERYRVWVEDPETKSELKKDLGLIRLFGLRPEQRFKVFLKEKDE